MEKRKTWWLMALIGLALALVPACGSQEKKEGDVYKIFYVNHDNTGVLFYEYETQSRDTDTVLEELIGQMETLPERLEYRPPLAGAFGCCPIIWWTGSCPLILTRNTAIRR